MAHHQPVFILENSAPPYLDTLVSSHALHPLPPPCAPCKRACALDPCLRRGPPTRTGAARGQVVRGDGSL